MTAFLIDDEPHCTDVLRVLLEKHCPQVQIVGIFNDPEAALAALPHRMPDLVFLDIEMPVLNGFDWLKRCPPALDFRLIFTTAYDQYAVKAFKFNALDYLLKPIDKQELMAAVQKSAQSALPTALQMDAVRYLSQHPVPERIALPLGQDLIFVEVEDLLYCESDGSYVSFYMHGQPKPLIISRSLREIEELLNNPNQFFRCHNSYLVNLKHIKKIIRSESAELIMRNDRSVPVARSKKQELMQVVVKV
jgi:two-component system, LytTR family, response regulator